MLVATAIAQRATMRGARSESFLIGRFLALSIRSRADPVDVSNTDWRTELPIGLAEAFDEDLGRLGDKTPLARTLLTALAWAEGPGLPWENVWVPVARAMVSQTDGLDEYQITDDDVRWLLDKAGAYIVEDVGPGQRSVYRPFHDLLAAHLRAVPATGSDNAGTVSDIEQAYHIHKQRIITQALLGTVSVGATSQLSWKTAHPYLKTYLSRHASASGPDSFTTLILDQDFLAVADPVTLTPLLFSAILDLRDIASIYGRARPLLSSRRPSR